MTQQLHVQAWNPEEPEAQPCPWQRGSRPPEGGLKPHALAITGEAERGADGGGVRQQKNSRQSEWASRHHRSASALREGPTTGKPTETGPMRARSRHGARHWGDERV